MIGHNPTNKATTILGLDQKTLRLELTVADPAQEEGEGVRITCRGNCQHHIVTDNMRAKQTHVRTGSRAHFRAIKYLGILMFSHTSPTL